MGSELSAGPAPRRILAHPTFPPVDLDTARDLPWEFRPLEREVSLNGGRAVGAVAVAVVAAVWAPACQ